jgi:CubicO group peptidase (beta-lactamase class C family)
MTDVHGWVAPGWEGVRDAFTLNMDEGLDDGAAFSAFHRGAKVADLWAGVRDVRTGEPWLEDTVVPVFSTSKGMVAACIGLLLQDGRIDVDMPVAAVWPEFAAAGKEAVTVGQVVSHQAGLAWLDQPMPTSEALSWDPVVEALAATAPHWEPGTAHGYHATTYGWLAGEIVRRVSGRSVGTFFHEEIAAPFGLDTWIGLPASEEHRVGALGWPALAMLASMVPGAGDPGSGGGTGTGGDGDATAAPAGGAHLIKLLELFLGADSMLKKALDTPPGAFPDEEVWNSRPMHAAEVPAANGITDARSLAKLYAACIGEVDAGEGGSRARLFSPEQMADSATQRTVGPDVVILDLDLQWGLGFMVHGGMMAIGGPGGFGHFGLGGSVGWAHPDADLAVGYVMNRLDLGLAGDQRSTRLLDACYAAIG